MNAMAEPVAEMWNSRFVEYARAHGRQPQEQLDNDRKAWPGGIMAGFQLWIGDRWSEWRKANGRSFQDDFLSDADHVSFDTWLATRPDGIDS